MSAVGSRPFLVMLVVIARDIEQRGARDAPADLREQSATVRLFDSFVVEDHQAHVGFRKNAMNGVRLKMLRDPPSRFGGGRHEASYFFIARQ
jgi:hypothetical protein